MTLFITVRNIAKLPMGCNARPPARRGTALRRGAHALVLLAQAVCPGGALMPRAQMRSTQRWLLAILVANALLVLLTF